MAKIQGMDTPEHVRDYFLAKGHPFLVFRVADLLELDEDDQILLMNVLHSLGACRDLDPARTIRANVQGVGFRGYVTIAVAILCKAFTIEELQAFQVIVCAYDGVRKGKMEPSRIDVCNKCGGKPRTPKCQTCDGTGQIVTLLEMSPVEEALAAGKGWDLIDAGGLV